LIDRSALTQGPVKKYGAVYDSAFDAHKSFARYESGAVAEWFGPFDAQLTRPVNVRDTFGRFNAGRDFLASNGRVFVTRYTHESADGTTEVKYHALTTGGVNVDIPAADAPAFLSTTRDDDGKLVFVNDDPQYRRAKETYERRMSN
jgi:hypothetical protein